MPTHLSDMTIDEISLVDEGANGEARVVIFKAKKGTPPKKQDMVDDDNDDDTSANGDDDNDVARTLLTKFGQAVPGGLPGDPDAAAFAAAQLKEQDMDIEALSKALEDAEAKLVALEKRTNEAESALEDANAVIKSKDDEITDLKKSLESGNGSEDDFMKSLPESVRKRFEDAEAKAKAAEEAVAKMQDAAETQESIAKAKELGVGNADEVGPLLLRVRKGKTTEADAAALETMLKAQAAQSKVSHLFKAMGSTSAVDGDPEALIKAKADEIQKANKGMTAEVAYAKAVDENPDLYNAYVNKRRVA